MKKYLLALWLIITSITGFISNAQTNSTAPQIVCLGYSGAYQVDYTENSGAGTTGSTYSWSVITAGFAGTITPNQGPGSSSNRILINWGTTPVGTYQVQVIETNSTCISSPIVLNVQIIAPVTPTFSTIGPLCQNSAAPVLPPTSVNGVTGTWIPATISTASFGTTTYNFTPNSGQCATTASLSVTITTPVTPTFSTIGPLCQNSAAPVLPPTSVNGVTGTWTPATISTATIGTTTYNFTPNSGQCATTASVSVTITTPVTPTFSAIGPLCQNSAAPLLPPTSVNGITGTWIPATISTATIGTTTYNFTPNSGQCATTASLSVTITAPITPTFSTIGPLCQNSAAPVLPPTSVNGITGTWIPATISTATIGTTTYNFTPNTGQCASTASLTVTITTPITPTFSAIGPLCQNSAAPLLPPTSVNGVTGTWIPATISTASIGTTTYNFTPNSGQCASTASLTVTITTPITPTFSAIGPLCQNSAAPVLPSTSVNGVTGTWIPATISTASAGATTYTFTPSIGQCAAQTTITITNTALPVTSPIYHD